MPYAGVCLFWRRQHESHLFSCLTLLACAAVGAQANVMAASQAATIRPGLWQVDSKMASPDAATDNAMSMVLQQLGNLPPDQRKQLESMAASRGMAMPTVGADGAVRVTACVTPDMAARRQIPTGQPGDCKSKIRISRAACMCRLRAPTPGNRAAKARSCSPATKRSACNWP